MMNKLGGRDQPTRVKVKMCRVDLGGSSGRPVRLSAQR
jgi:hypothetical protein